MATYKAKLKPLEIEIKIEDDWTVNDIEEILFNKFIEIVVESGEYYKYLEFIKIRN